jgi:hypothetical protein
LSIYKKARQLGKDDQEEITIFLEEGINVAHYEDNYLLDAIQSTELIFALADIVSNRAIYNRGNSIMTEMRLNGLLDEYQHDGDFAGFVSDVITENFFNYDWIAHETVIYDHKRGHTTFTAAVPIQMSILKENEDLFCGWSAEVQTEQGLVVVKG